MSTRPSSAEEPIRSPRPLSSCGVLVVNVGRAAAITEQARELGWATVEPTRAGDVLRAMWHAPALLASVVHVTPDAERATPALLHDAAAVVRAVRARRPELPVVGVTPAQSDDAERELRAAGATCYVAGDLWRCADLVAAAIAGRIEVARAGAAGTADPARAHYGLSPPDASSRAPP